MVTVAWFSIDQAWAINTRSLNPPKTRSIGTPACSTTEQAGSFFVCYVCNNRAFVHYVRIVFGHGFAVSSLYYRLSSGHRSTPAVDGFHFAIILYVTVRCLNVSTQKVKSYTFLLSNSVETHQNAHSNVQKCRKMAYTIVYVNFFLYLCSRFYARVRLCSLCGYKII